jgi:hypothetical protein
VRGEGQDNQKRKTHPNWALRAENLYTGGVGMPVTSEGNAARNLMKEVTET